MCQDGNGSDEVTQNTLQRKGTRGDEKILPNSVSGTQESVWSLCFRNAPTLSARKDRKRDVSQETKYACVPVV
ncbi:hypothetical protein MRX96_045673 [Rhipicephalus microplus]